MELRKSRRGFLGLLGAGAAGSVLLPPARAADDAPKKGKPKKKAFKGTSKKGNLQEALNLAVQAALKSVKGADRLAEWTLKDVSGRQGGVAGFNEVVVTIEASVS